MKQKLCCIGHITHDKIITPQHTIHMPGGTAFYFTKAIQQFHDIDYTLFTAVGPDDMPIVDAFGHEGIKAQVMPTGQSHYFENIYGDNPDNRSQRVLATAGSFTVDFVKDIQADIIHLGSLLANDFPLDVVKYLAGRGLISADSQGYLREVRDKNVYSTAWVDKKEYLPYIHFLKANEHEMEILTGSTNIEKAARELYSWGVKEILLTFGSMGSVIYDGKKIHKIPAYIPQKVVDATGCGDTYMTGYLYRRLKNDSIEEAGRFAAAMSTLKIEKAGAFKGSEKDIYQCMESASQQFLS